jgi:hypothetical protein
VKEVLQSPHDDDELVEGERAAQLHVASAALCLLGEREQGIRAADVVDVGLSEIASVGIGQLGHRHG